MSHRYSFLTGLLMAVPLAGWAQGSTPAPAFRYYAGLSAYTSDYQSIGGNSLSDLRVPIQATLGYQLRPRLAVQVSAAYSHSGFDYNNLGSNYYPPGGLVASDYQSGKMSASYSTLSLLARYAVRHPDRRLQVDVLGGFSREHETYRNNYQYTALDSAKAVVSTSSVRTSYTYTLWLLTAGLSTRYRLGQHLEAVLDATLNARVSSLDSPPTLAGALGVRYHFGKP
jgi:hypothetical protein